MATVTRDICKAKQLVIVRPPNIRYLKRRAHRAHRRAWRQHLAQVADGYENEREELELERHRLTGYDLA
jgi:hypothetical protein